MLGRMTPYEHIDHCFVGRLRPDQFIDFSLAILVVNWNTEISIYELKPIQTLESPGGRNDWELGSFPLFEMGALEIHENGRAADHQWPLQTESG